MKKIFKYAMIAFVGIALMSCDKDKNNADDPQTNSKEYLQLNDLTPLHLIPLSQAEAKLKDMGFKSNGYSNEEDGYIYYSTDKKESIVFGLNSNGNTEAVAYIASKGISPSAAKAWLTHIPETTTLPKYEIPLPFGGYSIANGNEEPQFYEDDYAKYVNVIKGLTQGMSVNAIWGEKEVPQDATVGYSIGMVYSYENNVDQAILHIACSHRVEPQMAD